MEKCKLCGAELFHTDNLICADCNEDDEDWDDYEEDEDE